jgi:hypothetical protein
VLISRKETIRIWDSDVSKMWHALQFCHINNFGPRRGDYWWRSMVTRYLDQWRIGTLHVCRLVLLISPPLIGPRTTNAATCISWASHEEKGKLQPHRIRRSWADGTWGIGGFGWLIIPALTGGNWWGDNWDTRISYASHRNGTYRVPRSWSFQGNQWLGLPPSLWSRLGNLPCVKKIYECRK